MAMAVLPAFTAKTPVDTESTVGRFLHSTYLTGGQTPRLTKDFFEKRRLYVKVLGDNIERKEVAVYAAACHCIVAGLLVHFARSLQQRNLLGFLHRTTTHTHDTP